MISVLQRAEVRGLISPRTVRRRAAKLLGLLDRAEADLVVVLTDDAEIQALNAEWRQRDATTDVLSFGQEEGEAMPLPPGMTPPLGDVVISLETASRQAEQDGCLERLHGALGLEGPHPWSPLDETTFLLLHGVLHLIGHDHILSEEAAAMEALEALYLPKLLNR